MSTLSAQRPTPTRTVGSPAIGEPPTAVGTVRRAPEKRIFHAAKGSKTQSRRRGGAVARRANGFVADFVRARDSLHVAMGPRFECCLCKLPNDMLLYAQVPAIR